MYFGRKRPSEKTLLKDKIFGRSCIFRGKGHNEKEKSLGEIFVYLGEKHNEKEKSLGEDVVYLGEKHQVSC